jgi:hypothetical protein
VLSLVSARAADPLAGMTALTSTGTNPAAAEVSHLQQANAQLTSELQVPLRHTAAYLRYRRNEHAALDDHLVGD